MRPRHDHKTTRIFSTVPELLVEQFNKNPYHIFDGILIVHAPEKSNALRRRLSIEAERPKIYVGSYAEFTATMGLLYLTKSEDLLRRTRDSWDATPTALRRIGFGEYVEKTLRWIIPLTISNEAEYLPKHDVFKLDYLWDDRRSSSTVYVSAKRDVKTLQNIAYDFKTDEIPAFNKAETVPVRIAVEGDKVGVEGMSNKRTWYDPEISSFGFIISRCLTGVE